MSAEKITKLLNTFNSLSAEEQDALLIDLNKLKKKPEINTTDISAFATRHQKEYGKDITFTIEKEEGHLITAVLHTVFGNFKGIGRNQKIAKIRAVSMANEAWD